MDLECEQAFIELKQYIGSLTLLSSLVGGKDVYLYVAYIDHAVSSMLVQKEGAF